MKPPEPNIDEHGVPLCTEECGRHDGKRCELLGHRPSHICEPAVRKLVGTLVQTKRELVRWQKGMQIEDDYVPPDANTACGECARLLGQTPLGTPIVCERCATQYDAHHLRIGGAPC